MGLGGEGHTQFEPYGTASKAGASAAERFAYTPRLTVFANSQESTLGAKPLDCMFSGEETSNDEHIIPRWMQRRFDLAQQTYNLPNGTRIQYRHAKIPVAQSHNTRFSQIEDRISRNEATSEEIFLWAMKVHIGLIYRSASLKIDIRVPTSPTFWTPNDFGQEVWLFRTLYKVWSEGGTISPNPFGTVFRAKALTPQPDFDFIHNMQAGVLFFQLGDEIILVVLYDQGRNAQSNIAQQFEGHREYLNGMPTDDRQDAGFVGQRVWACETAYFHYRSRQGLSFISSENSFHVVPPMNWRDTRPAEEKELSSFCRSFGLKLEKFGGEVGNIFSNLTAEDFADFRSGSTSP